MVDQVSKNVGNVKFIIKKNNLRECLVLMVDQVSKNVADKYSHVQ